MPPVPELQSKHFSFFLSFCHSISFEVSKAGRQVKIRLD